MSSEARAELVCFEPACRARFAITEVLYNCTRCGGLLEVIYTGDRPNAATLRRLFRERRMSNAPLDASGHIDAELWRKHRDHCRVRRFWEGERDEVGRLVHRPGGAAHARWVFDYEGVADEDDEAGYRFGAHAFRPGEYVSIRDEDEEMHTFQVVSVEPAT